MTGVLLLLAMTVSLQARTFEMEFWAGPDAEKDPRVVRVREHGPCSGKVALARITVMPPPSDKAALRPELAVEISSSGSIIRHWSLPVDSVVVAVVGQRLIIPLGKGSAGEKAWSISTSGELEPTTVPAKTNLERSVKCPVIPDFKGAYYVRCWEFNDIAPGSCAA